MVYPVVADGLNFYARLPELFGIGFALIPQNIAFARQHESGGQVGKII